MKGKRIFRRNGFSLRARLILAVACELLVSIFLALWLSGFLNGYYFSDWDVPLIASFIVISLALSYLINLYLSSMFFNPIKELRQAMDQVAEGDYSVHLHRKGNAAEIRDVYSGFNLMTQELRSTEILKTDFVSNVSHEFKTPLNAIQGYAMLLQDCDNLTPEQRNYVEKIVFNTERLTTLTGSILLLSKLENQQIPTNQTRFSLDEQIRQCIVALEEEWDRKDIEFDVDMEEVSYFGCENLLRHVWENLLRNAIKFSPEGSCVRVRLRKAGDSFAVTVDDQGPGIPEEAMKHIFNKFYQADSSREQEGNGLGLSLVDKILKLEKGTVTAQNLDPCGCRFQVNLQNK